MTNLPMNLTVKHVPQSNVFPILFPYDPYFVRIQGTVLQCNSRSNRFDSPVPICQHFSSQKTNVFHLPTGVVHVRVGLRVRVRVRVRLRVGLRVEKKILKVTK